ncbi:MAG: UDP-N-acetylmuramoyl-L-alanyl-D-glutamate--2,6-diaminopimelate ligase [Granulosicoccus sp.]
MSAVDYNWSLDALLSPWVSEGVPAIAVTGVNLDSRLVSAGDAYLAVGGATTHGMHYALNAVDAGAVAVLASDATFRQFNAIIDELVARDVAVVAVTGLDHRCGDIASRFYGEPDKSMTMVAVTGTDGKTSVCRFIAQAFAANHQSCGYIGTLGWGIGNALEQTDLTTPDCVTLRRMLAVMRDQGATFIALEASSHGIAEGRLNGLALDVAVLTNLGRDHLDYHVTVEAYRAAKERLFHWASLQALVLNADDSMGRDLIDRIDHVPCFSYSAKGESGQSTDHRVLARNVLTTDSGLTFDLTDDAGTRTVVSDLLGRFNVDNLLASYASLRACGMAANDASHCVSAVKPVAGRMERLGGGDKPTVVIDYSHTPNALQVAIDSVRVHCAGQLWVVFGCGGDRDKGKRAPMAQAAQTADQVVLTDDNPRTERSEDIINDVLDGFDTTENVTVIADRADAIRHALVSAQAGDLVLIAGKGHEDYQIIGTEQHHFSDREQAQLLLGIAS